MSSIDQPNKKRKILLRMKKKQLCEFNERNLSFTYNELDKKDKAAKYPDLENKRVITGDIILIKAKRFAELLDINDFKGSDGWVLNFKKRNNIKHYTMHGEACSAPSEER
nr:14910_t:CDS:2 [Entrophospora candida]